MTRVSPRLRATWPQLAWWTIVAISTVYGGFALTLGVLEALSVLGIADTPKSRAIPLLFVVHAITGGVALLCGPVQFSERLRNRAGRAHRALGQAYVVGVWLSSLTAIRIAVAFDVVPAAKVCFMALGATWFGATTAGFTRIHRGDVASHRDWMLRSFALTFFFVTFSIWSPALASTDLPEGVAYTLGVFLSGGLNVAVAELWIRRARP